MARYVAIIADGNRRWARKHQLSVEACYDAAADTLGARVRDAVRLGVEELSVYVFSTENWSRSNGEVGALMAMLCRRLSSETPGLDEEGVRIRFIGAREGISGELLAQMDHSETVTAHNGGLTLYLAINYGARAEIVHAARGFAGSSAAEFDGRLYQPEMHDPELIIRTGGEHRLSNFLLWQAAYSELVFCDELWPEFGQEAFEASLDQLDVRNRRFGGR